MILLDTHVLLWLDAGNPVLNPSMRAQLDDALRNDALVASTICFWEIAMLARKGRIQLPTTTASLRLDLLRAGLRELPISGEVGIEAAELATAHADPADRLLIATARSYDALLVTADERILASGLCRTMPAR